MKAPRVILVAVTAAFLASAATGCQDTGRVKVHNWPPRPVDRVDEIVLRLTPPSPVNWDDKPGPDGLQVQINFFQIDEPLSVTVKGSLDLALYDGHVLPEDLAAAKPIHTWPFSRVQAGRAWWKSLKSRQCSGLSSTWPTSSGIPSPNSGSQWMSGPTASK